MSVKLQKQLELDDITLGLTEKTQKDFYGGVQNGSGANENPLEDLGNIFLLCSLNLFPQCL